MIRVHQLRLPDNQWEAYEEISMIFILINNYLVFQCYLLEPRWNNNAMGESCIMEGSYILKKRLPHENGSRFDYNHFEVLDVPGRTSIKWHIGNDFDDTEGCGLPGLFLKDINNDGVLDVTSSRIALEQLWKFLPDECELIISKS